ncbi:Helix-turn-helix [Acidaminococcus fermentans]|uniref:helix-turn-helix domain-containing protein n=1 Tax=Acidaminococcus fermentans TaxID=905 RepID=UPI0008EF6279|nr:helix-turn-helix transcriptional regulator [Acidaminococcus fermentans]SFO72721.1 Helix-turn-helix [Acidaminococcus fermentans]
MPIRNNFAERLTILKENYNLTYADLARLLGAKNKATINLWVKSQKNFPNGEMLVLISRIFAVSLDWLLGNVSIDTPYREDLISEIEKRTLPIWERLYEVEDGLKIPDKYKDPEKRGQSYNLGQRANLIYGAMSVFYITLFTKYSFKEIMDSNADPMILSDANEYVNNNKLLETDSLYMSRMWNLIMGKTSVAEKAPYDIEKTIQDCKKQFEMNKFTGIKKIEDNKSPLFWE